MIKIKTLTKQEYEKNHKSPSEMVFLYEEKKLHQIIGLHLAETLRENIEICKKFLALPNKSDVYETEKDGRILYIVRYEC